MRITIRQMEPIIKQNFHGKQPKENVLILAFQMWQMIHTVCMAWDYLQILSFPIQLRQLHLPRMRWISKRATEYRSLQLEEVMPMDMSSQQMPGFNTILRVRTEHVTAINLLVELIS